MTARHPPERLWLVAALLLNLLFTARTMAPAFSGVDAVQDDAAQHVFWTQRLRDPELFAGDLYADYFQSLSPPGFLALYWLLTRVIEPLTAARLLPPILGLIAAAFTFLLVRRVYPSPSAAFLATVISSWHIWQHDDLPSATPRAFLLPAVVALLWAIAAGRPILAVALTVVGTTFYPVVGALGVAFLGIRLVRFAGWRPWLTIERGPWVAFLCAAALVAGVLLPEVLASSPYGPSVTAEQARTMPEFGRRGRNEFFVDDPYEYWLVSYRSGLNLRVTDALFPDVPALFELAALALLLPLAWAALRRQPAVPKPGASSRVLVDVLAASLALYAAAHLTLFRLYLPARYVQWTLPLVLAIAAGIGLAMVFGALARSKGVPRPRVASGLAVAVAIGLAVYPARYDGGFQPDRHPEITAFLRAQPKDVLVAALSDNMDFLPALSGRRVLVTREFALAYHLGYYGQVRERMRHLIDAYYDEGTRRVAELVDRYDVDLLVVDRSAFDVMRYRDIWRRDFEPFYSSVAERMRRPRRYGLQDLLRRCTLVDDGQVAVIPASCVPRR